MKPFNLEQAIAGAPLITRDGEYRKEDIALIRIDNDIHYGYRVLIRVYLRTLCYSLNGVYVNDNNSEYDLFMWEASDDLIPLDAALYDAINAAEHALEGLTQREFIKRVGNIFRQLRRFKRAK